MWFYPSVWFRVSSAGRRKEQYNGSIILRTLIASWKRKFHFLRDFSVDRVSFTGSPNYRAVSACIIRGPVRRAKYCSKLAILLSIPAHRRGNPQLLDALNVRNLLPKTTNDVLAPRGLMWFMRSAHRFSTQSAYHHLHQRNGCVPSVPSVFCPSIPRFSVEYDTGEVWWRGFRVKVTMLSTATSFVSRVTLGPWRHERWARQNL